MGSEVMHYCGFTICMVFAWLFAGADKYYTLDSVFIDYA